MAATAASGRSEGGNVRSRSARCGHRDGHRIRRPRHRSQTQNRKAADLRLDALLQPPATFTQADLDALQEDIADEYSDTEHRRWLISLKARIKASKEQDDAK